MAFVGRFYGPGLPQTSADEQLQRECAHSVRLHGPAPGTLAHGHQ